MTEVSKRAFGEIKRFLVFALGSEHYAMPLLSVREVIATPETTPLPYTPSHFLGIMNLRGQVISVIDLRIKFGIQAEPGSGKVVIVCDLGEYCLGVVVNYVSSVLVVSEGEIDPKPKIESTKGSDYIIGIAKQDEKLIMLLDIKRALDVDDKRAIQGVLEKKAA